MPGIICSIRSIKHVYANSSSNIRVVCMLYSGAVRHVEPNSSNCSLDKAAVTAVCLCTVVV